MNPEEWIPNYKISRFPRCWEVINCQESNRKKSRAYRFNLGLESCILRQKANNAIKFEAE